MNESASLLITSCNISSEAANVHAWEGAQLSKGHAVAAKNRHFCKKTFFKRATDRDVYQYEDDHHVNPVHTDQPIRWAWRTRAGGA